MKAYSLPKKIILKNNTDFKFVFKDGVRTSTQYFVAVFVRSDDLKVGFASSKEFKCKPTRNRIKRILRELWRLHFREYDLHLHLVIIGKSNVLEKSFAELEKDFCFLLNEINNHPNKP